MNDLSRFEVPEEGKISLCEKEGRLHNGTSYDLNLTILRNLLEKFPEVEINHEVFLPKKSDEEGRDLFIPVEMSLFKYLIQTYHEHGLHEVLTVVSHHGKPVISLVSKVALKVINNLYEIRYIWNPNFRISNEIMNNQNSQTRNWSGSYIRCIDWHKDLLKLAVALIDDSVRIYSRDNQTAPVFRCREQVNISCVSWRPGSHTDLAVGCEYGIIIWNVDPASVVVRASSTHAIKLKRICHKPVLSLTWSPFGDVLASAAGRDSKILIWNIEMDSTESLKGGGVTGYSFLKWSPDGKKLFTSSTCYVFRIWDCLTWESERWSAVSGKVQTACWSPCGNNLLFATTEEPIIYMLKFGLTDRIYASKGVDSENCAVPIYDVSKIEIGGRVFGGVVQSMDWEPKGHHLAVLFKECNCIAIFRVVCDYGVVLTPGFFISGQEDEIPNLMMFQSNFSAGACLTIGWSSGRIQYFPIEYTASTNEFSNNQTLNASINQGKLLNKSYF